MRLATIAVCVLVSCSTVFAADTLDEVKKKISERVEKHNSVQYTMLTKMNIDQQGMVMTSTSTGKMRYLKHEGKLLSRMEMDSKSVTKFGGNETKMDSKMMQVVDGEYAWTLSETMGKKNCTKSKVDKLQKTMDPFAAWTEVDAKLLPDETVDGKACWVIEMTPKQMNPMAPSGKSTHAFDKETGLMIRMIGMDQTGKEMTRTTVTDIKLNEKLDPKSFTFTPPEGVTVTDVTNREGM